MKTLITGGAGFIGSHLVDALLARGHVVVCVDNLYLGRRENIRHNLKNKRFKFYKLDVLDAKRMDRLFKKEKFDTVFHLVANSDIKESAKDTSLDLNMNLLSTCRVLEAMRVNKVRDMVFASTSAIFGETDQVITEDMGPLIPISFYGASKLSAEAFISAYVHNFGLRAWLIRFPNVVGGRATHGILYDLLCRLKKNREELPVLGDGTQKKPYLYVKELVEGILFVWEKAKGNYNYFNLGTPTTVRVSRIVEILLKELGLTGTTKVLYSGGDRGWVGDVPRFKYSVAKINRLGWRARLDSEESIRLTVRELKKEFGL